MKTNKPNTKAQIKTVEMLERRGYDHGYTQTDGNPVMVLRVDPTTGLKKNIWMEVTRNGNYRPASKQLVFNA